METYKVTRTTTTRSTKIIEANSKEEAQEIAWSEDWRESEEIISCEDDIKLEISDIFELGNKYGWGIFYTGFQDDNHNLYELQRIDDMNLFDNDSSAIEYVVTYATFDVNSEEAKAIRWLWENSPMEINRTFLDIVGSNKLDTCLANLKLI